MLVAAARAAWLYIVKASSIRLNRIDAGSPGKRDFDKQALPWERSPEKEEEEFVIHKLPIDRQRGC